MIVIAEPLLSLVLSTTAISQNGIRGFLHQPEGKAQAGLVITHGAGANCQAPLLVAVADAFTSNGFMVLRCDLPFRQRRPTGPPMPSAAGDDRAGLRSAVGFLSGLVSGPIVLGGHSYGGRQATMLTAEENAAEEDGAPASAVASALLLLSYPLHPPNKPDQLRTAHFPALRTPALFIHGTKDPFGTPDEMRKALALIPGRHAVEFIDGAGHDLRRPKLNPELIVAETNCLLNGS